MSTNVANGATAAPAASRSAEPPRPMAKAASSSNGLSDLGARTVSALVLIPAALAAAWLGGPWLAGAAGAAIVVMSYEWARMSAPDAQARALLATLCGAFGAVVLASWGEMPQAGAWIAAFAGVAALVRAPVAAPALRERAEAAFGVAYIAAPPAAFLWLRAHEPAGLFLVIGLFAIIWAADVSAYFGGRLIGGPRFAPHVSPNKTWAGVAAAMAGGVCAGALMGAWLGASLAAWTGAGLLVALMGLGGDLLESMIKRRFGVKDASRIIPGHGGMLDRLDGLMAATPATACAIALWPQLAAILAGGMR